MDIGHLLYVDGMITVTLGLPTFLVTMWALDRAVARNLHPAVAKAARPSFVAGHAQTAAR